MAGRVFCGRIPLEGRHRPACAAPGDDQHALGRSHGFSLHHYTLDGTWEKKKSATQFNVPQAMILTDKEKMILTPTYHVFDLSQVHQDAVLLPIELESEDYEHGGKKLPALSVSSSQAQDGSLNLSIVNIHPGRSISVECELKGFKPARVAGKILTAPNLNSHNTFAQPDNVKTADFYKATLSANGLIVEMPAKSVLVLNVK